jgi:hypothetical protein
MITWLRHYCMEKNLELEEVTGALLSHETRRKLLNDQADGLVVRSAPKSVKDKSKRKNDRGKQSWLKSHSTKDEESFSNAKDVECYYYHKKWHHRRFCKVLKQDLEDKKNQKSSPDLDSVTNNKSDDSEVSVDLLKFPQV